MTDGESSVISGLSEEPVIELRPKCCTGISHEKNKGWEILAEKRKYKGPGTGTS